MDKCMRVYVCRFSLHITLLNMKPKHAYGFICIQMSNVQIIHEGKPNTASYELQPTVSTHPQLNATHQKRLSHYWMKQQQLEGSFAS